MSDRLCKLIVLAALLCALPGCIANPEQQQKVSSLGRKLKTEQERVVRLYDQSRTVAAKLRELEAKRQAGTLDSDELLLELPGLTLKAVEFKNEIDQAKQNIKDMTAEIKALRESGMSWFQIISGTVFGLVTTGTTGGAILKLVMKNRGLRVAKDILLDAMENNLNTKDAKRQVAKANNSEINAAVSAKQAAWPNGKGTDSA